MRLSITGIRGIPANHGGFETFAEKLAVFLVQQGWVVTVYCQEQGSGDIWESEWKGVKRIHIPVAGSGAMSTILFDLKSILYSMKRDKLVLTLGYNTAIFNLLLRLKGVKLVFNMDGIEWRRQKWGMLQKLWLWLNERIGCWCGHQLIADNPHIADHLATRVNRNKITMIAYGAEAVDTGDESVLQQYGLEKNRYVVVIARPEPENSILEIVKAFAVQKTDCKLLLLGAYDFQRDRYHQCVREAASENVIFAGAIYDKQTVSALRYHARCYIHGHQVGGTNPSLVEALGAGNAVLAHDNPFNRWVSGEGARFFANQQQAESALEKLLNDDEGIRVLKRRSKENFNRNFRWPMILSQYQELLTRWHR